VTARALGSNDRHGRLRRSRVNDGPCAFTSTSMVGSCRTFRPRSILRNKIRHGSTGLGRLSVRLAITRDNGTRRDLQPEPPQMMNESHELSDVGRENHALVSFGGSGNRHLKNWRSDPQCSQRFPAYLSQPQRFNVFGYWPAFSSAYRLLPIFLFQWHSKWHSTRMSLVTAFEEGVARPPVRDRVGPRWATPARAATQWS
jgi:hypothetical protein